RGVFKRLNTNIYAGRQWNDERLVFGKWVGVNANANFQNFWFAFLGVQRNFARLDDLDTRGGPPIVIQPDTGINLGVSTDSRKRWGVSLNSFNSRNTVGGWQNN